MTFEGYRFSPIEDEANYSQALEYVATQATPLVHEVLGHELLADTITLFSHYDSEHEFLEKLVRQSGPESSLSHGATLYVGTDMTIAGQRIKILGVRQPDPDRPQVGYVDYPVADFTATQLAHTDNPLVRLMRSGNGIELLEIHHPDFDILGYLLAAENHRLR